MQVQEHGLGDVKRVGKVVVRDLNWKGPQPQASNWVLADDSKTGNKLEPETSVSRPFCVTTSSISRSSARRVSYVNSLSSLEAGNVLNRKRCVRARESGYS